MLDWIGGSALSRKSPIVWKEVCKPIIKGGLNIIGLECWNKITMMKLLWDLRKKTDNLWVLWLHTYYIKGQNLMNMEVRKDSTWIVKGVMKARLSIADCSNSWQQMLLADKFKMGKLYKELMQHHNNVDWYAVLAGNRARPRALFCLWLACHRRLATKERLAKFGIIRDTQCCFCREAETLDHLFYRCSVMKTIWTDILKWINIDHMPLDWSQELRWLILCAKGKGMKANLLKMAAAETLYHCWKFQNEACSGTPHNVDKVMHSIQEAIIHRGWNYRKYRDLIAKLLM